MIRVTKRRATGRRTVNAMIRCEEKIEGICFVSCTIRNGCRLGNYLCQVIENGEALSVLTSRIGDIRGKGEPVGVMDVEITKDNDFRARRL